METKKLAYGGPLPKATLVVNIVFLISVSFIHS